MWVPPFYWEGADHIIAEFHQTASPDILFRSLKRVNVNMLHISVFITSLPIKHRKLRISIMSNMSKTILPYKVLCLMCEYSCENNAHITEKSEPPNLSQPPKQLPEFPHKCLIWVYTTLREWSLWVLIRFRNYRKYFPSESFRSDFSFAEHNQLFHNLKSVVSLLKLSWEVTDLNSFQESHISLNQPPSQHSTKFQILILKLQQTHIWTSQT